MRKPVYRIGILISLIVFAVYSPALWYGFINLDDPQYVVKNGHIRSLDLSLLQWSFTSLTGGNWHPLTWISLAVDYALWGMNPMGFHLHNILLHAANVLLVMILTYRLLLIYRNAHETALSSSEKEHAFTVAALAALLFGLHPLRVESVVWITERKDVLYAFFFLLSLIAYLSYATHQDRNKALRSYVFSLVAFALSLMSKSMAVTLPAVLLLLDALCLGRMSLRDPSSIVRAIKEKLPFFSLSLAVSFLAISGQTSGGGMRTLEEHALPDRFVNAVHAVWFYVFKTVFPVDLSPFYPILGLDSLVRPGVIVSFFFLFAATVASVMAYRRGRDHWIAAGGYYLIAILPVIGIVQVGEVGAADRFTYLPTLSIIILLSIGLVSFVRKIADHWNFRPSADSVLLTISLPLALFLSPLTVQQITVWRDSLTLANRAVEMYPHASYIPYLDRGFALLDHGRYAEALRDCSYALMLEPRCDKCLMCRAEAGEKTGDYSGALSDYNAILRHNPVNADALNNRGVIYLKLGDHLRAQADFNLRDVLERGR